MFRLLEILIHTPDMERMRHFYERVLGLKYRTASDTWTAYETRGALLALRPAPEGQSGHVELTFATGDLEAAVATLLGHGVEVGEIRTHGWGRMARFADTEGNALAVAEPRHELGEGDGLALGTAIVNTRDMASSKAFYHHVLGLKVVEDHPYWTQFDAGPTALALHPRSPLSERHYAKTLAIGFSIPGLMDWAEEARARGLHFATAPRDEDWGLFSDAVDPDGNEITFFERIAPAPEEELAEEFDDDGTPHVVSIRKPLKKNSKAASRLVLRPEYKTTNGTARRRPSATTRRVASVRGAGPDHTRLRPKKTADEKKAKAKPAIGRLQKAKDATMVKKKKAVASASKGKPVKRGSARKGKGK